MKTLILRYLVDLPALKSSRCMAAALLLAWLMASLPWTAHAQSQPAIEAAAAAQVITEYRLAPDQLARSEALYRTRVALFIAGTLYGVAVLVAVLELGLARRLSDLAERVSPHRAVQVFVFAPLLLLSIDLLSLPLSLYGHSLRLEYGLSVQGWGSWLWDWTKSQLIVAGIGTLAIWGLYGFLRRSPRRWWLHGWLAAIPCTLLLVFAVPLVLDPLFNEFASLQAKQPELVAQLERITRRGGLSIERSRMFEMRASSKVTTYNAYVTGIGASKRVVVWDNTARELSPAQTMFIFAHEQGHYVLQHVWMGIGLALAGILAALYLAYRVLGAVLARYGGRWGIRDAGDWASLPVLLLLFSVASFLGQPISSALSRHFEHQADIYALEATHGLTPDSSQVAARTFQKLGEKSLSYPRPHPLYVFWVASHPPIHERVRFAARYQPWQQGQSGRYFK